VDEHDGLAEDDDRGELGLDDQLVGGLVGVEVDEGDDHGGVLVLRLGGDGLELEHRAAAVLLDLDDLDLVDLAVGVGVDVVELLFGVVDLLLELGGVLDLALLDEEVDRLEVEGLGLDGRLDVDGGGGGVGGLGGVLLGDDCGVAGDEQGQGRQE
jgi:hypothetical protein